VYLQAISATLYCVVHHAAIVWHMTHYNISVAITVDKNSRHLFHYCRSQKTCSKEVCTLWNRYLRVCYVKPGHLSNCIQVARTWLVYTVHGDHSLCCESGWVWLVRVGCIHYKLGLQDFSLGLGQCYVCLPSFYLMLHDINTLEELSQAGLIPLCTKYWRQQRFGNEASLRGIWVNMLI